MKKLMVFLAVLTLLVAISASAFAANTEVTFTTSGEQVYAGDEVVITVSVSGDTPYVAIGVKFEFDSGVFAFVRAEDADTGALRADYDEATNTFGVAFADPTAYEGVIQTIILRVKADAPVGTTTLGGSVVGAEGATLNAAQVTVACRHSYEWTQVDENTHKGVCACGDEKTENHDWSDEATDVEPATCTKPGSETLHCLVCNAAKTVDINAKGHAWDNDCDPDCNNGCGETRETSHKYSEKWSSDQKNHWHACTVCGDKKDVTAHKPGPAATEKDPQICTECDYVIEDALKHVHDFDTSIWQQDSENHWHVCKKAGCYTHGNSAKHVYDDECDVSCNVCSHVRIAPHHYGTEWQGNMYGHWMVCVLCGEQSSIMPHIPGDEATEETPQVCTECQYWVKYPLSHEHSYDMTWETDDYNHWKSCLECGEIDAPMPHSWDEGMVIEEPTDTKDGQKSYTCLDCGYRRIVLIPMEGTQQTDPTQPTDSGDPFNPADPTDPVETRPTIAPPAEKEEFPWWILAVAAGTLLVTGIVLFLIEFVRSRKHNMHGKFSK